MNVDRSGIPVYQHVQDPPQGPQITVWFGRPRPMWRAMAWWITKFSSASGIAAGSEGSSRRRACRSPGSDQGVCRLSGGGGLSDLAIRPKPVAIEDLELKPA
jgi:hypothetical protein